MENKVNYHGYLVLPRQAKLLEKDLGYALFGFYITLIMEAVWDRSNLQFSYITKSHSSLAVIMNCNQSTVSRQLKNLEKKKYLIRYKDSIHLAYFPLFLKDVAKKMHSMNYANLHELYADIHRINAELQEDYAALHSTRGQIGYQSFNISSKVNLSSFADVYIDPDEIDIELSNKNKEVAY